MDEAIDFQQQSDEALPLIPSEPAPPIQSRFLFVDVAALRAKQLRRGARVRFESEHGIPAPHKPERVAMEEVRRGLVSYDVPPQKGVQAEGAA
jgi:DNA-directed RNA polymerase omega subunit